MKPIRRNSSIIHSFITTHQALELDKHARALENVNERIRTRREHRRQLMEEAKGKKGEKKKESKAKREKDMINESLKKAEKFKHMDDHKIELSELYKKLKTDPNTGLTNQEAARLNKELGDNTLTVKAATPWYIKLIKEYFTVFALLLWVGAILCFVAYGLQPIDPSNIYLGIVLIAIIIISGTASFIQNYKSEAIMEGFKNFIPPKTKVLREGEWQTMAATKLVPGDIIEVKEGDKIPADFRVIQCTEMRVDNSSLTGESDPLLRSVECTNPDNPLETKNLCFFGTLCRQGVAKGVVLFIGDNTVIGQIANLALTAGDTMTPLQHELDRFIIIVAIIAVAIGIIFFIVGFPLGYDVITNLLFAIGLVVGNAPEGLLVTVTVSLTLAAKRLASKAVLAKNLQSVETLGSTRIICSDKTGTLTQNRMTIENLWYDLQIIKAPNKQKIEREGSSNKKIGYDVNSSGFKMLHEAAIISSEAIFDVGLPQDKQDYISGIKDKAQQEAERQRILKQWKVDLEKKLWLERPVIGDASETAIIKFFQPIEDIITTRNRYPLVVVNGIPCRVGFNSTNKFALSIVHYDEPTTKSQYCMFIKGAPERIWKFCTSIYLNGGVFPIDDKIEKQFKDSNAFFGKNGQRVLGFAKLHLDPAIYKKTTLPDGTIQDYQFNTAVAARYPDYSEWNFPLGGMTFIGLASLIDPPRDAVPYSIIKCKTAGIKVIMVTGDQPVTAAAIAKQVNIIDHNAITNVDLEEELGISSTEAIARADAIVIHGDLITEATIEDELLPLAERGKKLDYWLSKKQIVFARTSPAQKLIIVQGCQARNEIVAVTGDGVNDSPAIKKSDIGIAMGLTGSDVAKDAADLVLLTDDFSAIVAGIEEGRRLFDNLKKTISYSLTSNIPEVVPFILLILGRIPLPVTTVLLLCISVGTDMFPAISLAYEESELDTMIRKPRDRHEHLVTKKLLTYCYLQIGIFESFGAFLMYFIIMDNFGFPFFTLFGLALKEGYQPDPDDIFNPNDPYFGNSKIRGACDFQDQLGTSSYPTYQPDWIFSADLTTDFRMVFVQCARGLNGQLTGGVQHSIDFGACNELQISTFTERPICYTAESIKFAQTGYFAAVVWTQWACLIANKTRRTNVFLTGFNNFYQMWALIAETLFAIIISYILVLNHVLGTRPTTFLHFGVGALPFSLFILLYDEARKYLIARSIKGVKEGQKPGWWYRNYMWQNQD